MATESMTERLDEIVGEMRGAANRIAPSAAPVAVALTMWADRILAAAALERAEHRRQLDEALADPDWENESQGEHHTWCIEQFIASRRARMVKEG